MMLQTITLPFVITAGYVTKYKLKNQTLSIRALLNGQRRLKVNISNFKMTYKIEIICRLNTAGSRWVLAVDKPYNEMIRRVVIFNRSSPGDQEIRLRIRREMFLGLMNGQSGSNRYDSDDDEGYGYDTDEVNDDEMIQQVENTEQSQL